MKSTELITLQMTRYEHAWLLFMAGTAAASLSEKNRLGTIAVLNNLNGHPPNPDWETQVPTQSEFTAALRQTGRALLAMADELRDEATAQASDQSSK